nr:immunoglobulin heavy chain junction region [Macaca mulatta]MOW89081.1 immunoglobulin heavy chain junction region [Macaca mulatta]MOW89826.1 immunoglobulin heavy chain junction region [Macaca mulatta]MOW90422.1 immunoglobulin heavy chain junction region [Macaca mulatta]MOW90890.1 immunoglobulin heavy chain junction region [Macaca mulatta]
CARYADGSNYFDYW